VRPLVACLLGLLGAAACRPRAEPPGAASSATARSSASSAHAVDESPAGPSELAIVAPLAAGGRLGDFTVDEIRAVHRGRMRVVCARGRAIVHLDVALAADPADAGAGAAEPAAATVRYAIFYALRGDASRADGEQLAGLLARVLTANASVPAPPGLAVFTPMPDPGTQL
jgi:hypothetical protein